MQPLFRETQMEIFMVGQTETSGTGSGERQALDQGGNRGPRVQSSSPLLAQEFHWCPATSAYLYFICSHFVLPRPRRGVVIETDGPGSLSHFLSGPLRRRLTALALQEEKENSPFPGDPANTTNSSPPGSTRALLSFPRPGACEQSKHGALSSLKHSSLREPSSRPFAGVRDAERPLFHEVMWGPALRAAA